MVAACDIRHCSSDAFFKIAEVDIGIAADVRNACKDCLPDAISVQ
jgi:enoyl-CoA hydratase/carnithine racemase